MSDLPTLSDLGRNSGRASDDYAAPSEQEAIDFATKLVEAYNRGELLTRVEAANDPEVQKAVGWKLGYFDGKDWM